MNHIAIFVTLLGVAVALTGSVIATAAGLAIAVSALASLLVTIPRESVAVSIRVPGTRRSGLTPWPLDVGSVDGWLTFTDAADVMQDAEFALRGDPDDWQERLRLGLAREGCDQAIEADLQLGSVVEALQGQPHRDGDPEAESRRYGLVLAHAARGEHQLALRALEPLFWRASAGATPWTARARLRRCVGDLEGAEADASEAVRRAGPLEPWPHEVRGRLRLLRGDLDGAVTDMDAAVLRAGGRAWPHLARGVVSALAHEHASMAYALEVAVQREPRLATARLWRAALGDTELDLSFLTDFDAQLARCLRGTAAIEPLLEAARAWPWGERSVQRRLRRAHGLLAVAADARGDASAAVEHVRAVLALPDDGGFERDWAEAKRRQLVV